MTAITRACRKEGVISAILAEARRREAALLTEYASTVESRQELLHAIWSWISAPQRQPFLRLFLETYIDSTIHPETYSAEGKAMVTDWLNTLATALAPDGGDPITGTLVIAVIRGLLVYQLATNDHNRLNARHSTASSTYSTPTHCKPKQ